MKGPVQALSKLQSLLQTRHETTRRTARATMRDVTQTRHETPSLPHPKTGRDTPRVVSPLAHDLQDDLVEDLLATHEHSVR